MENSKNRDSAVAVVAGGVSEPVNAMELVKKTKRLTLKEESFCQYFVNNTECFDNACKSYAAAYGIDLENIEDPTERGRKKGISGTCGVRLLRKAHVNNRISELLRESFNDETMDRELAWVASQRKDVSSKVRALNEYNKLKSRIKDRVEHSFDPKGILSQEQLGELLKNKLQKDASEAMG